jgi:beta-galactosidase
MLAFGLDGHLKECRMRSNERRRFLFFACVIAVLLSLVGVSAPALAAETFSIGPDAFLIDGKPIQLISGEMHYGRIPAEDWRQRLSMARAMGLNAVTVYCFWNLHQPDPGPFNFTGRADVAEFCRIAQQQGLKIILRPGPYVCAEWEFGGFPAWLLKDHSLKVRTGDQKYEAYAAAYLKALGTQLVPLQIDHGGPIILVQVENEYGSFGNDKGYLNRLRDTLRDAGFTVPFFTADGGNRMMQAGHIPGVLPGLNGGGEDVFEQIQKYSAHGPYFVPEFYPGWLDHWGEPHQTRGGKETADSLNWLLEHNVSVSLYMFHGGTNWDGMSGANFGGHYQPQPTSYDYDAPLDESGRPTEKYRLLREVILKHLSREDAAKVPAVPAIDPPGVIAPIHLTRSVSVLEHLPAPVQSEKPLSMEDIGQNYGYILYRTQLTGPLSGGLKINEVPDYAYVSLNGKRVATIDRRLRQSPMSIDVPTGPATLDLLVENMGRINYGGQLMHNRKGITDSVTLAGRTLTGWAMYPLTPQYLASLTSTSGNTASVNVPAVYEGSFDVPQVGDTFLDLRPWTKGRVFVNGHDLGRYWALGPQQTLYLPGVWLKPADNIIKVFEQEKAPAEAIVAGLDHAILDVVNKPKRAGSNRMATAPPLPAAIASGSFPNSAKEQTISFSPLTARYVALQALSSQKGDDFANAAELNVVDDQGNVLPQDKLHIAYADSEENLSEDGSAENVLDGDTSTIWHTQYNGASPPHPHLIVLDLGQIRRISALKYIARESDSPGRIKDYKIYAW